MHVIGMNKFTTAHAFDSVSFYVFRMDPQGTVRGTKTKLPKALCKWLQELYSKSKIVHFLSLIFKVILYPLAMFMF